jgi:hypothetical protein
MLYEIEEAAIAAAKTASSTGLCVLSNCFCGEKVYEAACQVQVRKAPPGREVSNEVARFEESVPSVPSAHALLPVLGHLASCSLAVPWRIALPFQPGRQLPDLRTKVENAENVGVDSASGKLSLTVHQSISPSGREGILFFLGRDFEPPQISRSWEDQANLLCK